IAEFKSKIDQFANEEDSLRAQLDQGDLKDRGQTMRDMVKAQKSKELNQDSLNRLMERIHADDRAHGTFDLICPMDNAVVLNYDFRENLTGSYVKPSDKILRLGDCDAEWEVEVKIPQKYAGHVWEAFQHENKNELDVRIVPFTSPTRNFLGKLSHDK